MLSDILHGHFDQETLIELFAHIAVILLILPLHEFAHAWTANKLGDDTAKYQGRMTINPLAHIDPIGALCLLVGGFGWAKPVPIDPSRFNRKHSMRFGVAITALAGPVSNLIAAFIGKIIYRFYELSPIYRNYLTDLAAGEGVKNGPMMLAYMLSAFVSINIGLALFNLIPIPPLDGSKILAGLLPESGYQFMQKLERLGPVLLLVFVLSDAAGYIISPGVNAAYQFLYRLIF